MGSPRRRQKDPKKQGDIRDRLQALAKSGDDGRKRTKPTPTLKNQNPRTTDSDKNRNRNGRKSDSLDRNRRDGNKWTKKTSHDEARNLDRWDHSGFKELYKNELEVKSRRSRSRDKITARRSVERSRDQDRDGHRNQTSGTRDRSGADRHHRPASRNRGQKRSLSSETDQRRSGKRLNRSREDKSKNSRTVAANSSSRNSSGRGGNNATKKSSQSKNESTNRKVITSRRSVSRSRSRSPIRAKEKSSSAPSRNRTSGPVKPKRGPISPPESSRSRSSTPANYRRGKSSASDRSSRSSSTRSLSSRSRSSSSSSGGSSSSSRSRIRGAAKPRSPLSVSKSSKNHKTDANKIVIKKENSAKSKTDVANHSNPPPTTTKTSAGKVPASSLKKQRLARSDSESSSNPPSSSESEEGEDDDEVVDHVVDPDSKSSHPVRLSLSERFGKLAQLSSQRRNLELVQLRIVAPVGAATNEKNVSVDESSAAPVITNSKHKSRPAPDSPPVHVSHSEEDPSRRDERLRDDRWRDWHERYDQYRHVQPPRQLPRDWDDIRTRHKYYTERGYFGHDMTLDELSRWESWWHRYQQWRRGYERAWAAAHGSHVPVEYPDWSNYHSNNRENIPSGSIRSRLGWRR